MGYWVAVVCSDTAVFPMTLVGFTPPKSMAPSTTLWAAVKFTMMLWAAPLVGSWDPVS